MTDVSDYESNGISEKPSDEQIIKFIFDLSKEMSWYF